MRYAAEATRAQGPDHILRELKTAIRATREAAAAGDKAAAATALALAGKKLDKAVSKGVIHKNQAANRKSALAKKVSAL